MAESEETVKASASNQNPWVTETELVLSIPE